MFKRILLGCLIVLGGMLVPSLLFMPMPVAAFTVPETHCIDAGCDDAPSGGGSGGGYNSGGSSYDYEAERRAQEAAEEQRKRDAELEQQRKDADERRLQEEAERQAKFIRERDEAAVSLRVPAGMRITPNTPGGTGLKGALNDTGLRGSQPPKNAAKSEQARAWQQLHCVAAITGYALKALENGKSQEFDTLINEASVKFDGGRPGVECPVAPAMPDLKGRTVDMEQVQGKQKKILERAGKIAGRMKQTDAKKPDAQAPEPVPANETDLEKTIRVQKKLNRANEQPVHNQQEEKDRKELTKLILENEKLITVGFSVVPVTTATRAKKPKLESPSPVAQ